MSVKAKSYDKGGGVWMAVLPNVAKFLDEHPLASAAAAAAEFNLHPVTLANRLEAMYPGRYDFTERRRKRGERHKAGKKPQIAGSSAARIKAACVAILNALATIEREVGQAESGEGDK